MAFMEPHPGVGYDEVPWYRKTWFFMVLLFTIWPLTLFIVLSGDLYQKANKKQRKVDDAEVWRSTGSGKFVMVLCAILLGAMASIQYVAAFNNREAAQARSRFPATASAAELPEPTTTTTEAVETTLPPTTLPAESDGVPEFLDELRGYGTEGFTGRDPIAALALLGQEGQLFPIAGEPLMRSFGVSAKRPGSGLLTNTVSVWYLTDLSVGDAAAVYRAETPAFGIPFDEESSEPNDFGTLVELSYGGSGIEYEDPDIRFARTSIDILDTEDGVLVRVRATISRGERNLMDGSLLQQLTTLMPTAEGYAIGGASIDFRTINPEATTPDFSIYSDTEWVTEAVFVEKAETERIAEIATSGGLWVVGRTSDAGSYLDRLDGIDGELVVTTSSRSSGTTVRTSIRS